MSEPPVELLVIGLDAATFEVMDPLIEAGRLPNLARLMRDGAGGALRSTVPPLSAPAWTTFLTGLNPGHHGVYDFREFQPQSYQTRARGRYPYPERTLLGLLNAAGKRVGCVGMPMTYPPFAVDGFLVPGFDAPRPSPETIYPPEAYSENTGLLDGLTFRAAMQRNKPFEIEPVREEVSRIVRVTRDLQGRYGADALIVVFSHSDHVGHCGMRQHRRDGDASPVSMTYQVLDEAVGQLLDALASSDTTVVVLSDHGMTDFRAVVDLDALFVRLGLVRRLRSPRTLAKGGLRVALRAAKGLAHGLGLRGLWRQAAFREGLLNTVAHLNPSRLENISWETTRAFPTSFHGLVRVNLKGREGCGSVDPQDYDETVREVVRSLREARDAKGNPLFEGVFAAADLYGSGLVGVAPDVVVVPRRTYFMKAALGQESWRAGMLGGDILQSGPQVFAGGRTGIHDPYGVLICAGPHIRAGARLEDPWIGDLAPTLLYASGLPIPDDLDGRVLTELFTDDWAASHTPRFVARPPVETAAERSDFGADELDAIEESLRALGYV
jgi:predicted AlkP superfamily phosphohydrolase/phosphomutase